MSHAYGTTEALAQSAADLEDAGMTDTRTYRAIQAELARRSDNNAPAVSPGVAAPGDEGINPNHQQRNEVPVSVTQTHDENAVDVTTGSIPPFDGDRPTHVHAMCVTTEFGNRERVVFVDGTSYDAAGALDLIDALLDGLVVIHDDEEAGR